MNGILEVVWRTTLLLAILLIIARLLGRRTLAQLTFFDFVVGITIGNIAASTVSDKTANLPEIIASLATATLWVFIISLTSLKSLPARKLLESQPIIVIYKGQILEENLRQKYYNVNDLLELLREQEIFSPNEVEIALIETDGALSVLKRPVQPPEPGNMSKQKEISFSQMVGKELIIDGKIIADNLNAAGITTKDLMQRLAAQNIMIENVTLGMLTPSGKLYIDQKQDNCSNFFR